jgi:glycosyltransferase involved in cell wall biosynthesis
MVTTSEELTRKICRHREGVTTIQNYAVLEELVAGARPETANHSSHVLIDCGGVSPRTSTRALFEALSLLPAVLDLKLILAGPVDADARFEEIQALAGWKRVEYQGGTVSRPQMIRLMAGAGMALILYRNSPNNNDVRSNRFFEALASGLPVIAPTFPHWRKAVESIGCRLTVDPTDPEAIAKAINLITHPESEGDGTSWTRGCAEEFQLDQRKCEASQSVSWSASGSAGHNRHESRRRNLSGMS